MGSGSSQPPLRPLDLDSLVSEETDADLKRVMELREEIVKIRQETKYKPNVMVLGEQGVGKSSMIGTCKVALQPSKTTVQLPWEPFPKIGEGNQAATLCFQKIATEQHEEVSFWDTQGMRTSQYTKADSSLRKNFMRAVCGQASDGHNMGVAPGSWERLRAWFRPNEPPDTVLMVISVTKMENNADLIDQTKMENNADFIDEDYEVNLRLAYDIRFLCDKFDMERRLVITHVDKLERASDEQRQGVERAIEKVRDFLGTDRKHKLTNYAKGLLESRSNLGPTARNNVIEKDALEFYQTLQGARRKQRPSNKPQAADIDSLLKEADSGYANKDREWEQQQQPKKKSSNRTKRNTRA